MTLDDLRAAHPTLGFAVYAYTPGEPVTLEVHDAGNVYTFTAATLQAVVDEAFPPVVSQPPLGEGPHPSLRAAQEPQPQAAVGKAGGGAETTGSVFD